MINNLVSNHVRIDMLNHINDSQLKVFPAELR